MGILNIRPAKFGGSKAIVAIAGNTGCGKTLTALLIARGMVKDASKIGFLDTENGRGSFYADKLDGKFMIADLFPPFSPDRYASAIKEFQNEGMEVLVIDSVSHEWEGEGGCDDIANMKVGKMANWIGAKREHKRFMNTLLQSNMHIICCIRAREKTDFKNPKEPVSLGIQPICEKNFMFEMTASFLIANEGKNQQFLKIPYFLKDAFGTGAGYLGIETGRKIMDWINTGEKEDPAFTQTKAEMLMCCEQGLEAVKSKYETLDKAMKLKIYPLLGVYKESAAAYDQQAKEATETPQEGLAATLHELQSQGKQAALNMA